MADEQTTTTPENSATTAEPAAPNSDGQQPPATTDTSTTDKPNEGTILGGSGSDDAGAGADGDGSGAADGSGDPAPENTLLGAPEGDYEIAGLPEGTSIDKEVLDAIVPVAKEIGLSNEGMSRLASVYAEQVLPHVASQVVSQIETDIAATRTQWAADLRASVEGENADPVYAGAKLADVTRIAAKAIDRFAGEEFRAYLDETGLGNHPAMLKLLFNSGSRIAEDTGFERGGTTSRPKSDAEIFYGAG